MNRQLFVERGDASVAVTDLGGPGPTVVLLHGLAGSSTELLPTAEALSDSFRVLLIDQRGHGRSTRRPADVSRDAFVGDVVAVIEELAPGRRCVLVGQSMGAHTAFLTASARPDLVERLVMLEGHAAGKEDSAESAALGEYFASWPIPFADSAAARGFLGDGVIADAWITDLEPVAGGLRPRFEADIMQRTIAAVHEPRWGEWGELDIPTLAIFAKDGMFSDVEKNELIRRRPQTERVDLAAGSHDAHLDAFDEWIAALRGWLTDEMSASVALEGRVFAGVSNAETGQVDAATRFHYHEDGAVVWAEYSGGEIVRGYLVGTRAGDRLSFRYVHLAADGATASGVCDSRIRVLADGRVRFEESWAWESRPETGTSIVEEIR